MIFRLRVCLIQWDRLSTRRSTLFVISLNYRLENSYYGLFNKIIWKSRIRITLEHRFYHTEKFISWGEKFIHLFELKLFYFCHILFFKGNRIISRCPCPRGRNSFLWEILKLFEFKWWYLKFLCILVPLLFFFRILFLRVYFLLWRDFIIFTSFLYWRWGFFLIWRWTTDKFSWRAHITRKVINQQK